MTGLDIVVVGCFICIKNQEIWKLKIKGPIGNIQVFRTYYNDEFLFYFIIIDISKEKIASL